MLIHLNLVRSVKSVRDHYVDIRSGVPAKARAKARLLETQATWQAMIVALEFVMSFMDAKKLMMDAQSSKQKIEITRQWFSSSKYLATNSRALQLMFTTDEVQGMRTCLLLATQAVRVF